MVTKHWLSRIRLQFTNSMFLRGSQHIWYMGTCRLLNAQQRFAGTRGSGNAWNVKLAAVTAASISVTLVSWAEQNARNGDTLPAAFAIHVAQHTIAAAAAALRGDIASAMNLSSSVCHDALVGSAAYCQKFLSTLK